MAITKIHAIKSTLGKALAYIENPDKTDGQMLVSGYNCEPQTASIDFEMTAVLAHKARNLKRKRSTNLAYHLIQSFSPEDAVTPEQAHELGKKLAFEYTGGKYEYVVATHIDKGHIHNHIMINAVSFYDYKKLRTVPYRTARQIRDISDRLCMEAHLSVIDDPQKIGQLYLENAGEKKSVSNRTEIRKRLNFCLERATDYSQFLSMAKELKITPTIRGKHMSYLLEGAGRAVRDNSLSDTDTFTYAGICARLSDNAQEQKYLRETITGILSSATGMADFADKLKVAGIETKVKKATGQVLYRAAVLDGAWVPEDALGSEFTSEGIEYALKNGKMQIAEDAEITLIDRYQELKIQYPEVCTAAVKLSSRQILSAGKNGLVLQVHDDNGNPAKLMVNKSEVTTSPDGEITFNVGNDFSYDLVYEDETHGTIRGAKLIQQIDEENQVEPVQVILSENQIKAMSIRGVTLHLPQNGIERLFIPEKYVLRDLDAGQCTVILYPNLQYSYVPIGDSKKRLNIQGDRLSEFLGSSINPITESTGLKRKIAAVERRAGIENAKFLGKMLQGMTDSRIHTTGDYDKVIHMFKKPIDRDIKGVIVVGEGEDSNAKQELEEYVVTRELSKHFREFFDNYKKGIVGETTKTGVWISGFFGSGKSHFLKILSYLLDGQKLIGGKRAVDYFIDDHKIEDAMVLADMKLAADTPTDVVLFNIDSKSEQTGKQSKDAIVTVFLKVFNEMQGFYGSMPYVADLERQLSEDGRYNEFKQEFAAATGKSWEDSRRKFDFIQDDIVDVLVDMDYMSEPAARNWCEKAAEPYQISIENFARMVREYIEKKGHNHHVCFLVDEVGQYIGDDSRLMLNLQTIREELGKECKGKAWVIVTSQQDVDSIRTRTPSHRTRPPTSPRRRAGPTPAWRCPAPTWTRSSKSVSLPRPTPPTRPCACCMSRKPRP